MARDPYAPLLTKYVKALDWAVREAKALRKQDFERLKEDLGGDTAKANAAFAEVGPLCVDPYVIGAVRKYWLACQTLNDSHPATAVTPATFIVDRLRGKRPDLAAVVAQFPYWPVGLTADGRWI
jgi:hypothetical protein